MAAMAASGSGAALSSAIAGMPSASDACACASGATRPSISVSSPSARRSDSFL